MNRDGRLAWLKPRRLELALFIVAICLYLPGIGWGIPPELIRDRTHPWGSDETADMVLSQLNTTITRQGRYDPQYPLFGYMLQAVAVAPYTLVAGRVYEPGTSDPAHVLRVQQLLARGVSVVLAAALVIVAMRTAAVLWGPAQSWIAGVLTMLLYPMFYYGRTSNVDLPALFFTAIALWVFANCLKRPLDRRLAIVLGVSAALAVATKDPSYGAVVPIGVVIAIQNWTARRNLVLLAAGVSAAVYVVASGMVFNLDRYLLHINFIRHGSTRHYHFFYGSTRSYPDVLGETSQLMVEAMSLPVVLLAMIGFVYAVRRDRRAWLWLLPAIGTVVLTILPVRYVLYRFVMIPAYVLTFFAAYALSSAVFRRAQLQRAAIALVCGWALLRGADLTYQMLRDSRYDAGEWMRANLRPGDRVGYYGTEPVKLPFLPRDIEIVPGPTRLPAPDGPEFLVVEPWQVYEPVHEYALPDDTYAELLKGSGGYEQELDLKTPALFPSKPGSFVNPPVKVFARHDRAASLTDPHGIALHRN